jgi:glycosyltransferase involved in cell wall biosynthesis
MPKISIVTPSYNQCQFLEFALESVRAQNYPSIEHIVIDGASTDGSVAYLRSLTGKPGWKHVRWTSEPDAGQSDALNKGFRLASGQVVGWLNSDDVYRRGCFETVSRAFEQQLTDVLYGDTTWIDEKGALLQVRREIGFSPFVMLYHRALCVPTASTFFARRIFEDGNFLDIEYRYAMDLEFFLRLQRKGYKFRHIPELLADFRWHSASKSSSAALKQFGERDEILPLYSPLLANCSSVLLRQALLSSMRSSAAIRYWGEKFLRGFYFERLMRRFRPNPL